MGMQQGERQEGGEYRGDGKVKRRAERGGRRGIVNTPADLDTM